jgi:hypothetical protein
LWRYATATGTWTNISPVAEADTYYGFSGLTVDRQHPGTVMATAYSSWWPDTQIFRSTDSGSTWTRAWDYTSYPNRANRYTTDVSSSPWLTWNTCPSPPEQTPKLGWMTESLEIDPFNSARMMYGTGATLYGTENLTNGDSGCQFTVRPMVQGLEETAVNDLAAPPSGGAQLLSALGDIGGFRHTDLTKVPSMMFTSPTFTSTTSLDYTEANSGIPAGAIVESDRVDPKTFCGFTSGQFYVSSDGGATFAKLTGVDQADTIGFGRAAPSASYQTLCTSARICGVRGIFRSTDKGATWTRINDDTHQWSWTGAAITGDPRVYVSTNERGGRVRGQLRCGRRSPDGFESAPDRFRLRDTQDRQPMIGGLPSCELARWGRQSAVPGGRLRRRRAFSSSGSGGRRK